MKRKKTNKMLALEAERGITLEKDLPDLITEMGMSATADSLGLSKATLGYWCLKMDIDVRRVAIGKGDRLTLRRANGATRVIEGV